MRHHNPETGQPPARWLTLALLSLTLCHAPWSQALPEDENQPIHISADQAVRNEKQGVTIYSGNVEMSQGSLLIEADKITIFHDDQAADKIIASGKPARLQQRPDPLKGPVEASAETIEYYKTEERIHLITNALIKQDGSTVKGQSINYFVAEQKVMADSDVSNKSDRVEVIIPSQALQTDKEDSGTTKSK
jgi:lipopolysaccharide export system protein LptA